MAKSIAAKQKRPGRPATGHDKMYGARLSDELVRNIDAWAKAKEVSRSEAIRRLVEKGLRKKATINDKLDEALDESFPASDPVAVGHSEHAGQPRKKRKPGGDWPKGAVGLKGKQ